DDGASVRRVRGPGDLSDLFGKPQPALDAAAVGIDENDVVSAARKGDVGHRAPVRRPGSGAVDESERIHVRVGGRTRERADDLPRPGIREIEVEAEEVL